LGDHLPIQLRGEFDVSALGISRIALLTLATLAAAIPASGVEEPGNGTLTLLLENDFFYRTDENYTNGIAFYWVPSTDQEPDGFTRAARWIPWFPEDGPVRHGYVLGQNIYTPKRISLPDPPLDDRPYAGWLYLALGLGVETGRQLDQFAFTLGVVGPASLAEETQTFMHAVTDSEQAQGWDTQIGNEIGIVLAGSYLVSAVGAGCSPQVCWDSTWT
jgi:hypothetical protein